jgi:hypothetical protein
MPNHSTVTTQPSPAVAPALPARIPPLENGDRLTRAEFERRYDAMPNLKKAELIEGVVHMPSPVNHQQHGGPHGDLIGAFWLYQAATPGVDAGDNSSVRLDTDNMPQPDALLFILPECGGRVRLDDGYIAGAPDLVGEVSSSTVSIDLGTKLQVYRRNQVQEYIVWRVLDEALDWFVWREGSYERLPATPEGISKSEVFPGLWLDAAALLRRDSGRVLEVLQQGLNSPDHQAFVERLRRK